MHVDCGGDLGGGQARQNPYHKNRLLKWYLGKVWNLVLQVVNMLDGIEMGCKLE